jgi:hypothetical protein
MVGTECRTSRRPFTMVSARYLQGVKALGALPGGYRYSASQKSREWAWPLGLEYFVTHGRKGPVYPLARTVLAPVQCY